MEQKSPTKQEVEAYLERLQMAGTSNAAAEVEAYLERLKMARTSNAAAEVEAYLERIKAKAGDGKNVLAPGASSEDELSEFSYEEKRHQYIQDQKNKVLQVADIIDRTNVARQKEPMAPDGTFGPKVTKVTKAAQLRAKLDAISTVLDMVEMNDRDEKKKMDAANDQRQIEEKKKMDGAAPWVVLVTVPFSGHAQLLEEFQGELNSVGFRTDMIHVGWKNSPTLGLAGTMILEDAEELKTAAPTEFTWSRASRLTPQLEELIRHLSGSRGTLPGLIIYDFFAIEGYFVAKKLRIPCVCSCPALPGPNLINEPIFKRALEENKGVIEELKRSYCGDFDIRTLSDAFFLDGAHDNWFWAHPLLVDKTKYLSDLSTPFKLVQPPYKPLQLSRSDRAPLIYVCLGTVVTNNLLRQQRNKSDIAEAITDIYWGVIDYAEQHPSVSAIIVVPSPEDVFHELTDVFSSFKSVIDGRVSFARSFDQKAFLEKERPDVFITHGGASSAREATCADVPMIVIPFFGDQHECAKQVELTGGGYALLCDDNLVMQRFVGTDRARFRRDELAELHDRLDRILFPQKCDHNDTKYAPKPPTAKPPTAKLLTRLSGETKSRPFEGDEAESRPSEGDEVAPAGPSPETDEIKSVSWRSEGEEDEEYALSALVERCRNMSAAVVFMREEGDLLFGCNADRKAFSRVLCGGHQWEVGNLEPFSSHSNYVESKGRYLPSLLDQYNDVALDYPKFVQEWHRVGRDTTPYGKLLGEYRSFLVQRLGLAADFSKPIPDTSNSRTDDVTEHDRWIWNVISAGLEFFVRHKGFRVHFVIGPNLVYGRNKITTWELKWLLANAPSDRLFFYQLDGGGEITRRIEAPTPYEMRLMDHVERVRRLYQKDWFDMRAQLKRFHERINDFIPCEFQARLKSEASAAEKIIHLPPGFGLDDWIAFRFIHPFTRNLPRILHSIRDQFPIERYWTTEQNKVGYMLGRTKRGRTFEVQLWPTVLYTCFAFEHDRVYKARHPLSPQEINASQQLRQYQHFIQNLIDANSPPIPYPSA